MARIIKYQSSGAGGVCCSRLGAGRVVTGGVAWGRVCCFRGEHFRHGGQMAVDMARQKYSALGWYAGAQN